MYHVKEMELDWDLRCNYQLDTYISVLLSNVDIKRYFVPRMSRQGFLEHVR